MSLAFVLAYARFYYYQHGWPAALGLVLVGIAVVTQILFVPELKVQTNAARTSYDTLYQRTQKGPSQEDTSLALQSAFLASLPTDANANSDAIKSIHRLAALHGVRLATGDYRLVREGGEKLQRHQITLPANANYAVLRAWLTDVMNEIPSLALDEVSLRREDVGNGTLQARFRFTFFVKGP